MVMARTPECPFESELARKSIMARVSEIAALQVRVDLRELPRNVFPFRHQLIARAHQAAAQYQHNQHHNPHRDQCEFHFV